MGIAKGSLSLVLLASLFFTGCARHTPTPITPSTPKLTVGEVIGIVQERGVSLLPKTKGAQVTTNRGEKTYLRGGTDEWRAGDFVWSAKFIGDIRDGVWSVTAVEARRQAVWTYYEKTDTVRLESNNV